MANTLSIDEFVILFMQQTKLSPMTVLAIFLLTLARLLPIVALSPFFGAKAIPSIAKMALCICLCLIILPQNLFITQAEVPFDLNFMTFLFKEVVIGFLIGFLVSIPFFIVQSSGSLIDHMRGSSSLQVTDPSTQSQTGPIGILYNYVLIAVFYALNGPFLLFDAVIKSYKLVPPDQFINKSFFYLKIPFWKMIVSLFTYVMTLSIQLAAPSLVGIIMAEMFLGIANRLSPNVQIVFLGIPLKSWLGIALLAMGWALIIQQMGKESISWMKTVEKTLFSLSPSKA